MNADSTAEDIEAQKHRADMAINAARRAGIVRCEERDRIAAEIEMLIYTATQTETIDTLISLARTVLDPVPRR